MSSAEPATPQAAEFDTVAEWTAEVARDLGPAHHVVAGCRGSGSPAALQWLLDAMAVRPGDLLLDAGAGVGGPAEFAAGRTGARPLLAEPEPGACRAAARLFPHQVVRADVTAVPFPDAAFDTAWCLGVLCTLPGTSAQLAALQGLRRVVRAGGAIGLLVFEARRDRLTDPPVGNHFPTAETLDAIVTAAELHVTARQNAGDLPSPPPEWGQREDEIDTAFERRYGSSAQYRTAEEQSRRIGRLLSHGELAATLLCVEAG